MAQRSGLSVFNSRTILFVALICTFASASAQDNPDAVETILTNARIYTVNAKQPWAEALAIRGGKIIAVGTNKEMAAYRGPFTKTLDAQQHLVLPGFVDCHIHFMEGSLGLTHVDLNDAGSVAEIQKRVKEYAAAHPDEP